VAGQFDHGIMTFTCTGQNGVKDDK
jgi:hypothetical protein